MSHNNCAINGAHVKTCRALARLQPNYGPLSSGCLADKSIRQWRLKDTRSCGVIRKDPCPGLWGERLIASLLCLIQCIPDTAVRKSHVWLAIFCLGKCLKIYCNQSDEWGWYKNVLKAKKNGVCSVRFLSVA